MCVCMIRWSVHFEGIINQSLSPRAYSDRHEHVIMDHHHHRHTLISLLNSINPWPFSHLIPRRVRLPHTVLNKIAEEKFSFCLFFLGNL